MLRALASKRFWVATFVKVFIENEAGSHTKNLHDEKTLRHTGSVRVSRPYPFPYGFVIDTVNEEGDNLDCFVLTHEPLKRGSIIDCEVVGLMEQTESGQQDNNILASLPNEPIVVGSRLQMQLTEFVSHVFDHVPGRDVRGGRFLGVTDALQLIAACRRP
jgi:inorganic pyrophosphatase